MRIGIDVRYLSHGLLGGVHTYVAHFVPSLIDLARSHDIYLYADRKRPFEMGAVPDNVTVRFLPWQSPPSSIINDLRMRSVMALDNLDVAHFPANYGFGPRRARTVITLHDAINVLPLREIVRGHPKRISTAVMMTYLHIFSSASLRRANLILTVSEHARSQIAHYGRVDSDKIVVIPHAPTPDLRRIDDAHTLNAVRTRYGIERPFVLADALKNPSAVLRAWGLLSCVIRDRHDLILFSRRKENEIVIQEAVSRGSARLLIRPPREDLIALYSLASAFVFPSWTEGFGIPLLEAMTCGTPIVASNRGAIPEVVDDAALLSDPDDAPAIAQHLASILDDPEVSRTMRDRGFARAAQFSWQNTARRILDSYQFAVQGA